MSEHGLVTWGGGRRFSEVWVLRGRAPSQGNYCLVFGGCVASLSYGGIWVDAILHEHRLFFD